MAAMYGTAMQGASSQSFTGSSSQRASSSSSSAQQAFSSQSARVGMAGRAGAVSVGGAGYGLGYGGYGAGIGSSAGIGYGAGTGYGVGIGSGAGIGYGVGIGSGAGIGYGTKIGYGSSTYGLGSSATAMGASYGAIAGAGGIRAAQASGLGLGAGVIGGSGMVSPALSIYGRPSSGFGVGVPGMPGAPGVPGALGYAPFAVNEKQLLHSLNDRLASYLEKVKNLESVNHVLEEKLRAFTINKVQIRDLQVYEDQLVPLRQQLVTFMLDNSRTALELDNAKLTADDFRMKYETEYNIRESVEADIAGLKGLKTEYDFSNQALRQEFQLLTDEFASLRTIHEQEVVALRSEMAGTVTVDLQAGETINLSAVLQEMRSEYEAVVQQNRQEVETWYEKQATLNQVVEQHTAETTVSTSTEILESRKFWHSLQTELDSLYTSRMTLEENLLATESQFQVQVQRLNGMVVASENELTILRDNALVQAQDYQNLLNIKMRLEMEIATYKQLLEGADMGALVVVCQRCTVQLQCISVRKPVVSRAERIHAEWHDAGGRWHDPNRWYAAGWPDTRRRYANARHVNARRTRDIPLIQCLLSHSTMSGGGAVLMPGNVSFPSLAWCRPHSTTGSWHHIPFPLAPNRMGEWRGHIKVPLMIKSARKPLTLGWG
ncbi:hypothetical protein SKAU_G00380230 [Synaphobranchus kaupii]|uniref:IF rod domain-containing protein n=1 Tax=Synaphobranchus kaupii TaxID=118154 RepID=A0A9Q1EDH9_SYNKA|nr:hypothetical protein SKAU_G00380230 [Synaphobranchus kaupii]